jgi:DNA modification methylase
MQNETITWHAERRSVSTLKMWDKNPRKIAPEKLEQLMKRITDRGFHDVVKIDIDGTILSGNQRRKALMKLGMEEVTVLVPNRPLTEDERTKIGLESNTNDGTWDLEKLSSFDFNLLDDIHFDKTDLLSYLNSDLEVSEDEFDEQEELKNIKEVRTKLGDIIELGSHRLICGDSTDPEVLKKLFGSEKASMIYSDSVYNIKIDYNKGIGGKASYGGNVTDDRSDAEYQSFIEKSLRNALSVTSENAHVFYWCDETYIWLIQIAYRAHGVSNKRVCMWIKNGQNPTPQIAFNKCYEPCVYGTIGRPFLSGSHQDLNEIMNKETGTGNDLMQDVSNLWAEKRLSGKDYEHATSKPPRLHEKAIRRCTKPNDIILDSFAGSGSTLIAAEQLKRRVYAVELEPVFCDLIIRRYEKLTGAKARITNRHEEA